MTTSAGATPPQRTVRVPYAELTAFTAAVFEARGVPAPRAATAARALVHGDLTGVTSHGLANLTRLYLPLFDDGRVDPAAEPKTVTDTGAAVLLDAQRALGLWSAAEAMDLAMARAAEFGVGMVSAFNCTHLGCAGYYTRRAADQGMVGFVASNCGQQRIIRPPGGRPAMLGTNPFSVSAPAGDHPPFVLDMSSTVVPTGRIRAAERAGKPIPEGWLVDAEGAPVTDPGAFDRGEAYLQWLGGRPETGAYKGYGLGLMVETLAALVPGAGFGPAPEAYAGSGGSFGRDDNIGFFVLAIAPGRLRPREEYLADAQGLFGSLADCPPIDAATPVSYPGRPEAARIERDSRIGVELAEPLYGELLDVAGRLGLTVPPTTDPTTGSATDSTAEEA
jgi:LDH2 family malate/lactate/ureidoglycolate dehydrogenase